jgi:hypothetical protein
MSENKCGGCTECCTTMRVESIGKDARVACPQLCKGGCSIYETRPDPCEGFQCVWLVSQAKPELALPSNLRPDRSGVVLEMNEKGTVIAHSRTEGAWREPRMLKRLMGFARNNPVTIDLPNNRVLLLDKDGTAEELEFLEMDPVTNLNKYKRKFGSPRVIV